MYVHIHHIRDILQLWFILQADTTQRRRVFPFKSLCCSSFNSLFLFVLFTSIFCVKRWGKSSTVPISYFGQSLIQPRNCNSKLPLFSTRKRDFSPAVVSYNLHCTGSGAMQCKAACRKRMEREFSGGFPDILQHLQKMSPCFNIKSLSEKYYRVIKSNCNKWFFCDKPTKLQSFLESWYAAVLVF